MKNRLILSVPIIILLINCTPPYEAQKPGYKLYLTRTIKHHTKLSLRQENNSAFDIDINNLSKDVIVLKKPNAEDLPVADNRVSSRIDANTSVELINTSKTDIRLAIKVYNHTSKIIENIDEIK
jgi:hypothetical protein